MDRLEDARIRGDREALGSTTANAPAAGAAVPKGDESSETCARLIVGRMTEVQNPHKALFLKIQVFRGIGTLTFANQTELFLNWKK